MPAEIVRFTSSGPYATIDLQPLHVNRWYWEVSCPTTCAILCSSVLVRDSGSFRRQRLSWPVKEDPAGVPIVPCDVVQSTFEIHELRPALPSFRTVLTILGMRTRDDRADVNRGEPFFLQRLDVRDECQFRGGLHGILAFSSCSDESLYYRFRTNSD